MQTPATDQTSPAPLFQDIGIWLISLRSATERRERTTKQLTSMGLNYTIFDAIDGNSREQELESRVDKQAYEKNMGSLMLPGKMGVYASHIDVWQAFLLTPYSTALILEDDVVFHSDFLTALETAMSVREQWDIIRFNCVRAQLPVTQAVVGDYKVNAYIGPFTGNATYLITRDTVEKILPGIWPQTRALDHELNRFFVHNYRQFGLEPWSSHPDDGGSSQIIGQNSSLLKKPHWTKRLPHFQLKAVNYFRRAFWLLKNGHLKRKTVAGDSH